MMKKSLLMIAVVSALLASCGYDNPIDKDLSDELDEIVMTPSSVDLFLDTEIPHLLVICIPSYARDTTLTWSSSRPDLVEVDAATGEIRVVKREPTPVNITATSRDGGHSASCVFNLKMITTPMEWYVPIDERKSFGFWILDRNVGSASGDEWLQWGCNTAALLRGWGGSVRRPGCVNWVADPDHSEYIDWSVAVENSPCPKGWRMLNRKEMEDIAAKVNKTDEMPWDDQKRAEILFEKLKIGNGSNDWGYVTRRPDLPQGDTIVSGVYDAVMDVWNGFNDVYWWSSERVAPEDQEKTVPEAYALHLNKNNTAEVIKVAVRTGCKVRCVK